MINLNTTLEAFVTEEGYSNLAHAYKHEPEGINFLASFLNAAEQPKGIDSSSIAEELETIFQQYLLDWAQAIHNHFPYVEVERNKLGNFKKITVLFGEPSEIINEKIAKVYDELEEKYPAPFMPKRLAVLLAQLVDRQILVERTNPISQVIAIDAYRELFRIYSDYFRKAVEQHFLHPFTSAHIRQSPLGKIAKAWGIDI